MMQPYGSVPTPRVSPELWRLVKTGRVYSLSFPIAADTPQGSTAFPFTMQLGVPHSEGTVGEGPFAEATMRLSMSDHTSTHIDALCHYSELVGGVRLLYEDLPVAEVEGPGGFAALGIDRCPPIVTRGVLLDVARFKNVEVLPDSYGISADELEACARSEGVGFAAGDCVLLRTGFSRYRAAERERFSTVGAGPTPAACAWLGDRGIAMAGADTMSFEQVPSPHMGHLELTRRRGIPIINQVDCDALAHDGVHEFLFVALPLKLRGATASPVNPIAIC
jgi:kynurenine formamidase